MNEKDLITLDHDNAFTTSLIVAEKFGKRHDNVLKAILSLECSDAFRGLNFEATFYAVPGPKNSVRQEIMYQIHRDGFAFLAMGFTGKEAAAWKEAFILAFNQMEHLLIKGNKFDLKQANTHIDKLESYWFGRYPHWRFVRSLYYSGYPFRYIASRVERSASACRRAVKSMERCGLVNPRYAALHRMPYEKYQQWLLVNAGEGW